MPDIGTCTHPDRNGTRLDFLICQLATFRCPIAIIDLPMEEPVKIAAGADKLPAHICESGEYFAGCFVALCQDGLFRLVKLRIGL